VVDRHGSPILSVGKVYDVVIAPAQACARAVAACERLVKEPACALVAKYSPIGHDKAPLPRPGGFVRRLVSSS
jgi:hypothetical protein